MENIIQPFTFVNIIHDNFKEEHAISNGDILFVAGAKAFPLSEEDPYTQRIKFFVQRLNEDETIDDEGGFFVMDAVSLKNVTKEENDRLSLLNLSLDEDAPIN